MLLAGCAAGTSSTGTAAKCAGLKPITYSSASDTKATVDQIKIHNQTLRNLGCLSR